MIGGSERGRRLRVPKGWTVRPTPDRVRETLFNWLQGEVPRSWALDLFSGSGALGIEALSRGAALVTLVEKDPRVLEVLQANLAPVAGGERVEVIRDSAWRFLGRASERRYDLVFLDPPFDRGWAARTAVRLEEQGWLAPGARVYLETGPREGPPQVPPGWQLQRSGHCGDLAFWLFECPIAEDRKAERGP